MSLSNDQSVYSDGSVPSLPRLHSGSHSPVPRSGSRRSRDSSIEVPLGDVLTNNVMPNNRDGISEDGASLPIPLTLPMPQTTLSVPTVDSPPIIEAEIPPPPYQMEMRVIPMTAEQSTRYDRGPLPAKNRPKHVSIPMALYTLTPPPSTPVPQGWIEFVHPEGQKYYYQPNRRIITDSNIKQQGVLHALLRALAILDTRLNQQNLILPQTTEVVFEVDIEQEPPVVRYYFVDHAQKTEFWLEKTTTESLKCPPVISYTHLKYLFRQHYWTHIEFYPMHLTLSVDVEDELVAVLSHACVDYMTSALSTVPYNQEQCEAYLRLIKTIPSDSDRAEGYRNCVLARLWSEIDGNFFVNLRGEDTPRLSRTQRLLPEPSLQTTALIKFLKAWLMLGSSEFYERALSEMWVDKISYASHWRKFMGGMMSEWKMHAIWTFVILIVSSLTFVLSMTSSAIREGWTAIFLQSSGLISIIIALVGLGASFLLVKMHRNQLEASASDAGDYLDRFFHKSLGLQPLSIIYALPQASSVWSFTFLATTILASTVHLDFIAARIFVVSFTVFIIITIWFLTMCLSGKDDGSGKIVKDSIRRASHRVTERIREIRRLTNRVGRRSANPQVGTRNENTAPGADSNNEGGEISARGDDELPSIQRIVGDDRPHTLEVVPSASTSNFSRQNVISTYIPRRPSTSQNIASTVNHITSTVYNSILSVVHRALNTRDEYHRYQRIETTETPLEAAFRNQATSSGRGVDLENQVQHDRGRSGTTINTVS